MNYDITLTENQLKKMAREIDENERVANDYHSFVDNLDKPTIKSIGHDTLSVIRSGVEVLLTKIDGKIEYSFEAGDEGFFLAAYLMRRQGSGHYCPAIA